MTKKKMKEQFLWKKTFTHKGEGGSKQPTQKRGGRGGEKHNTRREKHGKQHHRQERTSGKTTPTKRTTVLSFSSLLFTLWFDFAQTLLISIPKRDNGSTTPRKWREATPPKNINKTSNTPKEEGERGTDTQKERRDCNTTTIQERKTTPHQTRTDMQHQPKQHRQKGRGRKAAPPQNEEGDPQLYFYLLLRAVMVSCFEFVSL